MSHMDYILQKAQCANDKDLHSFSHALIRLIQKQGYEGDEQDPEACTHFLYTKYQETSIPITKATLKSWFSGEKRPFFESRSRKRMYQLCFVLKFDYQQVYDFFEHVYLSRSFNCRNILEAVYCYCFAGQKDYSQACSLYSAAQALLASPELPSGREVILYTGDLEKGILTCQSDKEFLDYVKENEKSFREYNQSARRELKRLLERIQGSAHDQELVNSHRKNGTGLSSRECEELEGLAVRDYFRYHDTCQDLKGQNVSSADFMLSQILGIRLEQYYGTEPNGMSFSHDARLEQLIKINFPSSQSLSDILRGKSHTSFDAVRKMIILLHFYSFFVSLLLEKDWQNYDSAYINDANDQLFAAGYGPLYAGSPYDRIFMESAKASHPLDYFRNVILEAVETE